MQPLTLNKAKLKRTLIGIATSALCGVGLYAVVVAPSEDGPAVRRAAISNSISAVESSPALSLAKSYAAKGYTLDAVRSGRQTVPTLSITELPKDIGSVRDVKLKKSLFFRTLLPMALQANAQVAADRVRLTEIRNEVLLGQSLSHWDKAWLSDLSKAYKTEDGDINALMRRVAPVPVSLVLAQAAEESGWGSSRFAREGNALFGQWTWNDDHKGIVPAGRDPGKTHRIRAFDTANEAIAAYIHNLNTHPAYKRLRDKRATGASGYALTTTLDKYSERGIKYIASLKAIMNSNNLQPLDKAKLSTDDHLIVSR